MPESFDVFSMPNGTPLEEQRDFEIFWRKYTGRPAIVVTGVEYMTTLDYPEDSLDEILKYLNVSALKIKLSYNATKIEQIKITEEGRVLEPLDINKLRNRTLSINMLKDGMAVEYNEDWFRINTDNVVSSLGGTIIVEKNSYRITYVEG